MRKRREEQKFQTGALGWAGPGRILEGGREGQWRLRDVAKDYGTHRWKEFAKYG